MAKKINVLVVGLGRFGCSVAQTLDKMGVDIVCADTNSKLVQYWSTSFPCIEADMTDPIASKQVGLEDFTSAIVAIGSDVQASVLIAGNLLDSGVKNVWAKAVSEQHARILERIGVANIVSPEADAGSRVAHLVYGKMLDYIQVDEDFVIAKIKAPSDVQGFKLGQSRIRTKFGVTVLGSKTPGKAIEAATAETTILEDDIIIVGGAPELVEEFAKRGE